MAHDDPKENAKDMAGAALTAATRAVNESLSTFNGWLLGGTGAAFAAVFAGLESLLTHLSISDIRLPLSLTIGSLIIGSIARFLMAMVASTLQAGRDAGEIGYRFGAEGVEVDLNEYCRQVLQTMLPPARWFVARSVRKTLSGDRLASVRQMVVMSQASAWLVIFQVAFVLSAAGFLVAAMNVTP